MIEHLIRGAVRCRCLPSWLLTDLHAAFVREGYEVFTVAGSTIRDKATLFAAFEASGCLTVITPSSRLNWDGFRDELWDGLSHATRGSTGDLARPVALLWLDAHVACSADMGLIITCTEMFLDITSTLATHSREADGSPVRFRLCLLGSGPGFPPTLPG
jgi:hypothetical protein